MLKNFSINLIKNFIIFIMLFKELCLIIIFFLITANNGKLNYLNKINNLINLS